MPVGKNAALANARRSVTATRMALDGLDSKHAKERTEKEEAHVQARTRLAILEGRGALVGSRR